MDDRNLTMKTTGQYNRHEAELRVFFLKRSTHVSLELKPSCSHWERIWSGPSANLHKSGEKAANVIKKDDVQNWDTDAQLLVVQVAVKMQSMDEKNLKQLLRNRKTPAHIHSVLITIKGRL